MIAAGVSAAGAPAAATPNDQTLAAVAGTGSAGSSGDGGPATAASFNAPLGGAVAPDGTLYIADTGNHKVRAVAPDGTIRTVAGSGQAPARAPQVSPGMKAVDVALIAPSELAVGADGTLYIVDATAVRVYAVGSDGTITVKASAQNTDALDPPLGTPTGLAVGTDGTVYVADQQNNRVVTVTTAGEAKVAAGNGVLTATAAGGPATQVPVGAPNALAMDGNGDLWIAGGLLLRRLRAGTIATVTQPAVGSWAVADGAQWPPAQAPLNNVENIGAAGDGPYVFDRRQKAVLRLGPGGAVTTVASLDGADFAELGIIHLAAGPPASGTVYVVDTGHHRVWSAQVPADTTPRPETGTTPVWPWLAGGALLVIALLVIVLAARRRRAALH